MANKATSNWAKKTKTLKAGWKNARKKERSSGFDIVFPENVTYTFKLSGYKADIAKDGSPYVTLKFVCVSPKETTDGFQCKGKQLQLSHFLKENKNKDTGEVYTTVDQAMERLSGDLQALGASIKELEVENVPDLCEDLVKEKVHAKITIKKGKKKKYAVIDGVISSPESKTEEPPFEPDQKEEDEEEQEQDEEADDSVTSEKNQLNPQVGDTYLHASRVGLKEWEAEVTAVDDDLEEVDLVRLSSGKEFKKVPFSALGDKV